MKKLVAISMMVLATASLAMAVPSFTLPSEILIKPGETVIVSVGTAGDMIAGNGLAGTQGMNLNLGTTAPFSLSALDITGSGLIFNTNSQGLNIDSGLLPAIYMASVSTVSGNNAIGGAAATVSITCPDIAALIGTTGLLSTDLGVTDPANWMGFPSDFAGVEAGQATSLIRVVIPEPATALLLLAAVPFLRRRHA